MKTNETKIYAELIGENSAGLTVVQIYDNDKLVWSHNYFPSGASDDWYNRGLRQAYDDMIACEQYQEYEGCDIDDGEIVDYANDGYVVLRYTPSTKTWKLGEIKSDGQAYDFILRNADRLPRGIVADWKTMME
jgi:hypothetical protein